MSFLGFTNNYIDLIPGYAHRLHILDKLCNEKSLEKLWTQEHTDSFEWVKKMLGTSPVISHFDPARDTFVATDASDFAVSAVLYQQDMGKTKKYYNKFIHRNLSGGQLNYSATKREFYGIIFALSTFHNFLYGRKFQLMTDHKALTYILYNQNRMR